MNNSYEVGQHIGRFIKNIVRKKMGMDPDETPIGSGNSKREYFFVKQSQSNFAGPMCGIGSYLPSQGGAIQLAREAKRKEPNTLVQVYNQDGALIYSE